MCRAVYTIDELKAIRHKVQPDSFDEFFAVLEAFEREYLTVESKTLARQVEQAELNERKVD